MPRRRANLATPVHQSGRVPSTFSCSNSSAEVDRSSVVVVGRLKGDAGLCVFHPFQAYDWTSSLDLIGYGFLAGYFWLLARLLARLHCCNRRALWMNMPAHGPGGASRLAFDRPSSPFHGHARTNTIHIQQDATATVESLRLWADAAATPPPRPPGTWLGGRCGGGGVGADAATATAARWGGG